MIPNLNLFAMKQKFKNNSHLRHQVKTIPKKVCHFLKKQEIVYTRKFIIASFQQL